MVNIANGQTCRDLLRSGWRDYSDPNASLHEIDFKPLPHNESMELDIHRPYIDKVTWEAPVEKGTRLLDGTIAGESADATASPNGGSDDMTETMVRVP